MRSFFSKAAWLGIGRATPRWVIILLGVLPFILMATAYVVGSDMRLAENPSDKLMPSFDTMSETFKRYAFEEDARKGTYLLYTDWTASMKRLLIGMGAAAFTGLVLGIGMGLFPYFRRLFLPFVTFWSIVPPLAILPILFIAFGVDELGKVMLIFLGSVWFISRDLYAHVSAIPKEQLVKLLSFNASIFQVLYRAVLPQVLPRLVDSVRLTLGAAWLFLIASEAIAATDGLGYRIFLVRRYLAMDVIIPYVAVITLTGFALDIILRRINAWAFPWYVAMKRD